MQMARIMIQVPRPLKTKLGTPQTRHDFEWVHSITIRAGTYTDAKVSVGDRPRMCAYYWAGKVDR